MKTIIVSMTGFANDPKEEQYKSIISQLNMRYAPTLAEETSVLIVKQVTTQKYKIAKIYEKKMLCTRIEWLIQSHKAGSILDPQQFILPSIFYGVSAHIMGFNVQISETIKTNITTNGGICQIIGIEDIDQCVTNQQIKLLIINTDIFFRLKGSLNKITYPIVGIEWLENSISGNVCKFPYDYSLNQFELGRKDTIHHLKKMKNKLQLGISCPLKDHQKLNIFQNTFIFIGENIQLQMCQIFQKLIIVYGGFYLQTVTHNITHIITQPIQQSDYQSYSNNGVLAHILRVQWLLDSIYFNKKMPECDYYIRSYKKKSLNHDNYEERSIASSLTSRHLISLNSAISSKKSISMPLSTNTKHMFNPQKPKHKIDSNIFKDKLFYVQSSQRNQPQIRFITSQILRNNGKAHSSRRQIQKQQYCYYVLKDSPNCNQLIQTLKSQTKIINAQIQPVSYRWIKQCIAKVQFIDIHKTKSFIYKPFPFTTPIPGFHRCIFDAIGADPIIKLRIVELYNALGSMKNAPNKSQITHCLCYEGYEQVGRFKQIQQQNPIVIFLDWKWLIECFNTGKIAKYDKYLLEGSSDKSLKEISV